MTPSTSTSPTAPRNIRTMPRIHQRSTRRNTLMPAIPKEPEINREPLPSEWSTTWYDKPRKTRSQKKKQNKNTSKNSPSDTTDAVSDISYRVPTPKGGRPQRVTKETPATGRPPVLATPHSRHQAEPPAQLTIRRSEYLLPSYQRPHTALFIAKEALYKVLATGLENTHIFFANKL